MKITYAELQAEYMPGKGGHEGTFLVEEVAQVPKFAGVKGSICEISGNSDLG